MRLFFAVAGVLLILKTNQAKAAVRQSPWLSDILAAQAQQLQLLQHLVGCLVDQKETKPSPPAPALTLPDPYGDLIRDLPVFSYDKDDETTFDAWIKRYRPVIDDRGTSLTDERKRNLVIDKLDNSAYKTYAEHVLPLNPRDIDLSTTIQNLTLLFGPKRTLIRRRFEFLQSTCAPLSSTNVPYRDFGNTIKKKFEDAAMNDVDGESLKCLVFVAGLADPSHSEMRLRLLNHFNRMKEGDPSPALDDFINECETFVTLRSDNSTMEHKDVNAAYRSRFSKKKRRNYRHRSPTQERPQRQKANNSADLDATQPRSRNGNNRRNYRCKNVAVPTHDARTYLKVQIFGRPIRLQLDTGADITMISTDTWKAIGSPPIAEPTTPVKTADGSLMKIIGCFQANFTIYDRQRRPTNGHGTCYVTEHTNLLGLEWCIQMPEYRQLKKQYHCRLATSNLECLRNDTATHLKNTFPEVFNAGLGHCTMTKARLFLKPDARPVYKQKRPVPFASQPAVNAEIDRLLKENVLTAVDHSNWAAPIVVVKKSNGTIRICADFSTGLNDALLLHQHPLPTIEDVFSKLNGGQLFSQVDLADAYLQIEVDDDSKELLTINTHRGLFRYNRLPFGVKSAPGIFQQIIDSMIAGLPGVAAYLDDIIVTGRNADEHRRNLEGLFQRISNYGFRVRIDKCHFMMTEIRYLGNIIDKDGRRPDPEKIRAITDMPPPEDVTQLRSLLGMLNYYGAFIQDMRQLRAPMDALLKKDTPFRWSSECQNSFEKAKKILASPLLLTHYDPKLELIVAADASDYGVGAVLLHRFPDGTEKAVSHASRSLTDAEKKYGQIEKEGLALVFAVRKFHRYLFGRRFTLLTDHKPLVAIFGNKNGIPSYTANRLLRWSLILHGYDFKIEYRKTTEFGQADALSRLIAEKTPAEEDVVIAQADYKRGDGLCIQG
ncbi:hypothetical protein Q1695_004069 [Nippostrongylus brasiliensis]|nr:hypothetical protein Q1695_004069 [Nippostrongylus brasiliensis]